MQQRFPIGVDDFRKLREGGLEYVDKSHLIRELLDNLGASVTLLPRPRRFGKTLNLSMLRCFFEKRDEDLSHLFEGLSIATAGDDYRRHFQRHPVIHMTFKGIKAESWELGWEEVRLKIAALFDEHRDVLDDPRVSALEARDYRAILDGSAGRAVYENALLDLSRLLERRHGAPVVILLDEYDEPIHAAYVHGYSRQALAFYRAFLGEGLKGNPHLFKGVLTGVLRVARESIFSGLNNLAVYTLLRPEMDRIDEVRRWYDGYRFGDAVVYNPWSILNYAASQDKLLRNYWVTTSSNDLVRSMLQRHALRLQPALAALLEGGSIERRVSEDVVLDDLDDDEGALFDLLVFSGYLRAERVIDPSREDIFYRLAIPNREVREVYTTTFQRWMRERLGGAGAKKPDAALREGLAQIRENAYVAELEAAGAKPVHAFAAAFDGKRVWVRAATATRAEKEKRARGGGKTQGGDEGSLRRSGADLRPRKPSKALRALMSGKSTKKAR